MRITMRDDDKTPLKKSKLPEQVFDQLMEWIMEGKLSMGDKLVTDDLAEQLGVSRMPVREAIANLEAIGLAKTIPYAGTKLVKLEKTDVQEIYLARSALEPIAARFACIRITPDQLEKVEQIHEEYKKAVMKDELDPVEVYQLNRRFHFTIYKASGLKRICEDVEKYWDNLAYFKFIYGQKLLQNQELKEDMIREHQCYLDALREGDSDRLYYEQKRNLEKRAADLAHYTDGYFENE